MDYDSEATCEIGPKKGSQFQVLVGEGKSMKSQERLINRLLKDLPMASADYHISWKVWHMKNWTLEIDLWDEDKIEVLKIFLTEKKDAGVIDDFSVQDIYALRDTSTNLFNKIRRL